jgi:hypothetical protein
MSKRSRAEFEGTPALAAECARLLEVCARGVGQEHAFAPAPHWQEVVVGGVPRPLAPVALTPEEQPAFFVDPNTCSIFSHQVLTRPCPRPLSATRHHSGYRHIFFSRGTERKTCNEHIVVVAACLGVSYAAFRAASVQVDHKDGDKAHNHIRNLQVLTASAHVHKTLRDNPHSVSKIQEALQRAVQWVGGGPTLEYATAELAATASGWPLTAIVAACKRGGTAQWRYASVSVPEDLEAAYLAATEWRTVLRPDTRAPLHGWLVSDNLLVRTPTGRVTRGSRCGHYYSIECAGTRWAIHVLATHAFHGPPPAHIARPMVLHQDDRHDLFDVRRLRWGDQHANSADLVGRPVRVRWLTDGTHADFGSLAAAARALECSTSVVRRVADGNTTLLTAIEVAWAT